MAGGRAVHPDCKKASNPSHECGEDCFKKITEAKARLKKQDVPAVQPSNPKNTFLFLHDFPEGTTQTQLQSYLLDLENPELRMKQYAVGAFRDKETAANALVSIKSKIEKAKVSYIEDTRLKTFFRPKEIVEAKVMWDLTYCSLGENSASDIISKINDVLSCPAPLSFRFYGFTKKKFHVDSDEAKKMSQDERKRRVKESEDEIKKFEAQVKDFETIAADRNMKIKFNLTTGFISEKSANHGKKRQELPTDKLEVKLLSWMIKKGPSSAILLIADSPSMEALKSTIEEMEKRHYKVFKYCFDSEEKCFKSRED